MIPLVSIDIGGTHARFARAEVAGGRVRTLERPIVLRTADHAGLVEAFEAAAGALGERPRAAALALAGPVQGEIVRLTNNAWVIDRAHIRRELGLDHLLLINDFGAMAHAVGQLDDGAFRHVCGPNLPLPDPGMIGIVGPGTGLGVAHLLRQANGYHAGETEGGHVAFAPLDEADDAILGRLRARFGRVSVERIVSGPGLANIYRALAAADSVDAHTADDGALWRTALDGSDTLAAAALDRWCGALGAVAGDIALAQGAAALVLTGALALRLADRLPQSGFAARFADKGRSRALMEAMPVKLLTHEHPGLYGAAAAFARQHRE